MPWPFWAHRGGESCLSSRYVLVMCHVPHTSYTPGFIIKVKKFVECICVNHRKVKADIVHRISRLRLLVSHPGISNFPRLTSHPTLKPQNPHHISLLMEDIVNPTTYNWEDKYRPRKPRYFNRVHMGYEWNKYKQTHYKCVQCIFSVINCTLIQMTAPTIPLPKVVQGYKVGLIYTSAPRTLTGFSSIYFIRTSSTSRRLQHTKS